MIKQLTNEAKAYLENHEQFIQDLLFELCAIPSPSNHEELRAEFIKNWLEKLGCDEAAIDRVCCLVGRHHTITNVDGADCRILLEADFLVNAAHKKLPDAAVIAARESFFRTETGLRLLDSCLLKK